MCFRSEADFVARVSLKELSSFDISVVRKDLLKEEIKTVRKAISDASRALEKEQSKEVSSGAQDFVLKSSLSDGSLLQVVETINTYFKNNSDATVIVQKLEVDGNSKVCAGSRHRWDLEVYRVCSIGPASGRRSSQDSWQGCLLLQCDGRQQGRARQLCTERRHYEGFHGQDVECGCLCDPGRQGEINRCQNDASVSSTICSTGTGWWQGRVGARCWT